MWAGRRRQGVRRISFLCLVAGLILQTAALNGQSKKLTAAEAKDHIGEKATVCGTVASARYAEGSKGQPTFLNLDEPYPKDIFTILIWGSDRDKFGQPETKFQNAKICVTGSITSYRGSAEIIASDPNQITLE
jgi:DNA/RNA endonuclease YhcR with UshA esterase domain